MTYSKWLTLKATQRLKAIESCNPFECDEEGLLEEAVERFRAAYEDKLRDCTVTGALYHGSILGILVDSVGEHTSPRAANRVWRIGCVPAPRLRAILDTPLGGGDVQDHSLLLRRPV